MAISGSLVTHLNHMNKAAHDVSLGTLIASFQNSIASLNATSTVSGSYTATGTDTGGSVVTIVTGLTAIKGYQLDVFRSGSQVTNPYVVSTTSGSLAVRTGSQVVTGDLYNWIAW